jgi:Lar family restriction alleviation protein
VSEHVVSYEQVIKKKVHKQVLLELVHCPFCGGEAEFRYANRQWKNGGTVGVRCKDCGAMTAARQGAERQLRAAELWNRRARA